jgi:hypothetical protein
MDLYLRYKDVTLGIELKVWREKKRDPQNELRLLHSAIAAFVMTSILMDLVLLACAEL